MRQNEIFNWKIREALYRKKRKGGWEQGDFPHLLRELIARFISLSLSIRQIPQFHSSLIFISIILQIIFKLASKE